jgi:hypothetical protein
VGYAVGVRCHPDTGKMEEVWKLKGGEDLRRMDFDPGAMRGVATDFRLVTRLFDLRTGEELLKIDNSANYREVILSATHGAGGSPGGSAGMPNGAVVVLWTMAAVVLLVAMLAVVAWRRGRG